MLKNLKSSIEEDRLHLFEARFEPSFSVYSEDADFQKLLQVDRATKRE
jgi:hypothetical protein